LHWKIQKQGRRAISSVGSTWQFLRSINYKLLLI
jgi:hypothetical protein